MLNAYATFSRNQASQPKTTAGWTTGTELRAPPSADPRVAPASPCNQSATSPLTRGHKTCRVHSSKRELTSDVNHCERLAVVEACVSVGRRLVVQRRDSTPLESPRSHYYGRMGDSRGRTQAPCTLVGWRESARRAQDIPNSRDTVRAGCASPNVYYNPPALSTLPGTSDSNASTLRGRARKRLQESADGLGIAESAVTNMVPGRPILWPVGLRSAMGRSARVPDGGLGNRDRQTPNVGWAGRQRIRPVRRRPSVARIPSETRRFLWQNNSPRRSRPWSVLGLAREYLTLRKRSPSANRTLRSRRRRPAHRPTLSHTFPALDMPCQGQRLSLGQTLRGQYARREFQIRSQLRQEMNAALVSMSGCSTASMFWTLRRYLKKVFFALDIRLVWAPDILFTNLSDLTGLDLITRIFSLWQSGVIHFKRVTAAEREAAMLDPLSAAPGPLHLGMPARYVRSDIGARQYRPKTNPLGLPYKHERNGPKSTRVVSDEAEAAAAAEIREAKERMAALA